MTPPCYNRPPRVAGTWERTGRQKPGLLPLPIDGALAFGTKPVLRWRPSPFEDRCATHDGRGIGPKGESYPEAHGWDCDGCRWAPEHVQRHARAMEEIAFRVLAGGRAAGDPPGTIAHGKAVDRGPLSIAFPRLSFAAPVDKPADNPGVIPKPRSLGKSEAGFGWLVEEGVLDDLDLGAVVDVRQTMADRIRDRGLIPVLAIGKHGMEMHGYEPMGDWGAHEIADRIRAEHAPHCNLRHPATLGGEDDRCDCGVGT